MSSRCLPPLRANMGHIISNMYAGNSTTNAPEVSPAIGVVQVTVQSAHIIKGKYALKRAPNPFVSISTDVHPDLARTNYQRRTYDPNWITQPQFLLVHSIEGILRLNVYGHHSYYKHASLGSTSFDLATLSTSRSQSGIHASLVDDQGLKKKGEVLFDVHYHPVVSLADASDIFIGIVRLTIHKASALQSSERPSSKLDPMAIVSLGWNETPIYRTARCKHTGDPTWNSAHEYLCLDKTTSVIIVKVVDDNLNDPILGHLTLRLGDLPTLTEPVSVWWPLSECRSGKLMMSVEWKPLNVEKGALAAL